MKTISAFFLLMLLNCSADRPASNLETGTWRGHLTPMNHPEMQLPLKYRVSHSDSGLSISIDDENNPPIPTREIKIIGDTLFFVFNEPEANLPLQCKLIKNNTGGYSGKCTAPDGKWAQFTMQPANEE